MKCLLSDLRNFIYPWRPEILASLVGDKQYFKLSLIITHSLPADPCLEALQETTSEVQIAFLMSSNNRLDNDLLEANAVACFRLHWKSLAVTFLKLLC